MADHIEHDAELRFRRAVVEGECVGPAAVKTIRRRDVFSKGFFAIKEYNLKLLGEFGVILAKFCSQLDDERACRGCIISTQKVGDSRDHFGVEVGTENTLGAQRLEILEIFKLLGLKACDQIDKGFFAKRGVPHQ